MNTQTQPYKICKRVREMNAVELFQWRKERYELYSRFVSNHSAFKGIPMAWDHNSFIDILAPRLAGKSRNEATQIRKILQVWVKNRIHWNLVADPDDPNPGFKINQALFQAWNRANAVTPLSAQGGSKTAEQFEMDVLREDVREAAEVEQAKAEARNRKAAETRRRNRIPTLHQRVAVPGPERFHIQKGKPGWTLEELEITPDQCVDILGTRGS